MSPEAKVRDLFEQMVPLQEANTENARRLAEIRQEARSEGLNLDAVNALLPILVKFPHDKGAAVVNEIIRYAEAYGTENLVSQTVAPPPALSAPATDSDVSPPPKPEDQASARPRWRPAALAHLRLSTQVVAAVGVTVGLLWLLN